jgi:glycosyltransferase involved in cell wall biosynthesis
MRILVIHTWYTSGDSGENRVVADEVDLLRAHGHEVELWQPSAADLAGPRRALLAVQAVWSRPAVRYLEQAMRDFQPDVVHAHNLFPRLSPAVLREREAPVVVTLHNYRLLCLPATFLRDGRTCEDCFGKLPWRGVVHGCYRGSRAHSAALAGSIVMHRAIGTFQRPAAYLAVSEYVRRRHVEAGFDPERVWVKPNFVWATDQRSGPGRDFVYVGRLSPEKGLDRLLPIWGQVPARLVVVGDGPERAALEAAAPGNVTFLGSVPHEQVSGLLREARALVLPTACYEGAPRTVVEAYAAGVPVVASRIGAVPSVVEDGETGLLAGVGDAEQWMTALARLLDDGESLRMGANAYQAWCEHYSPKQAIIDLEGAYARVAAKAARPAPGGAQGVTA